MEETDEDFAAWVESGLEAVEARLDEVVAPQTEFLSEASKYLVKAGGKRFRPALVLAAGGLAPGDIDEQALVDSAVVVELTHVASLYHDDVMDEAQMRRGQASANRRWGNSVAIMVGDFLLATASLVGSTLGEAFVAHQSRTLARLVHGQIAELRGTGPDEDPVSHYLSVLSDKTASLIAASARYGAMVAGLADDQIEELTQFGEDIGMAFQLADDLIDIESEDSGKRPGTDLREGVLTMAPLLVIQQNRPADARLIEVLKAPVAESDLAWTLDALRAHPAIAEVRADIARRLADAKSHLAILPDSPAKRALTALADQGADRRA